MCNYSSSVWKDKPDHLVKDFNDPAYMWSRDVAMHLRVANHLICPQLNTLGGQLKTEHPGSPAQVPAQWLIRPSWDCSWGAFIKGGDFSQPSFLKNNLFVVIFGTTRPIDVATTKSKRWWFSTVCGANECEYLCKKREYIWAKKKKYLCK